MSRRPPEAIHLHIDRLVVDVSVLGDNSVPRDLDARLRAALMSRLHGEPEPAASDSRWIDSMADGLARRIIGSIPGDNP